MARSRKGARNNTRAPRSQRQGSPKDKLGGTLSAPVMPEDTDEATRALGSGRRNKLTAQVAALRKAS